MFHEWHTLVEDFFNVKKLTKDKIYITLLKTHRNIFRKTGSLWSQWCLSRLRLLLFVYLTQTRDIWDEGTTNWETATVRLAVGIFLSDMGGPNSLWACHPQTCGLREQETLVNIYPEQPCQKHSSRAAASGYTSSSYLEVQPWLLSVTECDPRVKTK